MIFLSSFHYFCFSTIWRIEIFNKYIFKGYPWLGKWNISAFFRIIAGFVLTATKTRTQQQKRCTSGRLKVTHKITDDFTNKHKTDVEDSLMESSGCQRGLMVAADGSAHYAWRGNYFVTHSQRLLPISWFRFLIGFLPPNTIKWFIVLWKLICAKIANQKYNSSKCLRMESNFSLVAIWGYKHSNDLDLNFSS